MSVLWTAVTFAFVAGVLGVVAFGLFRMFGGGHRPQH